VVRRRISERDNGPIDPAPQFGGASAPMIPQLVHTDRGPNTGTDTSLWQAAAPMTASAPPAAV
jgi:hypothetical protein